VIDMEWYKVPRTKKLHKARSPTVEFFLLPIRLYILHQTEYVKVNDDGSVEHYWSD
jgi:deoxycytidine triphosphate deaminase